MPHQSATFWGWTGITALSRVRLDTRSGYILSSQDAFDFALAPGTEAPEAESQTRGLEQEMSDVTILLLAAIALGCGCLGLLAVAVTNPRLLGMGWLGGAFAAGATGALLLMSGQHVAPLVSVLFADVLVLLALVLLHAAVQELIELPAFEPFAAGLFFIQGVSDLCRIRGMESARVGIVVAALLIALQAGRTAWVLGRRAKPGILAPAGFTAGLLVLFMVFNLWRSQAVWLGWVESSARFAQLEKVTFVMFLGFALAFAFGFFWMTTARLTASLDELASTDPLTRLFNRRVFLRWCDRELARARQGGSAFSMLMVDLDHFKSVNDQHGHAAGDSVLVAVVEKLQDSVRGIDVLGRWGGEEFVVLLPGASAEAAFLVAQRIRGNIERTQVPVAARRGDGVETLRVTASVGIAAFQGREDGIEAMLKRADAALYRAKAEGRNRVWSDAPMLPELVPAGLS